MVARNHRQDDDFGGVSIIAVGDLFQLEPVFDGCFWNIERFLLFTRNEFVDDACQIMRQRENHLFAEILNRLREGKHTEEDIRILKPQLMSENDPNNPYHVPHLFYQHKKCNISKEKDITLLLRRTFL